MALGSNWDDLRIFLAIARDGQLSSASRHLGMDHSTAVRRLAALEEGLGLRLFERAGRRLRITKAGETLRATVERMEQSLFRGIDQAMEDQSSLSGCVRVGAPEGLGTCWLSGVLARLALRFEQVEIELVALPRNYSLASREVDIAVSLDLPKAGAALVRKLTDYTLHAYAHADCLARLGEPTLEDGRGHLWCSYIPGLLHTRQLDYSDGLHPRPQVRTTSILAQREMIETGQVIGILPYFMARGRGGLREVLSRDIRLTRSYWITIHEDMSERKVVRRVCDEIAASARRDADVFADAA